MKKLNESTRIATIRATMRQLEQLAFQWGKNHAEQWQVYINDSTAPAKPGRFTYLAENQTRISQQYAALECDTLLQISHHDALCSQKGISYSANWSRLLSQLRAYLSGPDVLDISLR